jgi:haloalkane dehalogenase
LSWTEKTTIEIDGVAMAYVEQGEGNPVLFLHGNPTSSYLWRNIMPHVAAPGRRLIAPDLIGMGDSGKLPDSGPDRYTFVEHRKYLDRLLDHVLQPQEKVTLVVHDWGSALGFHWARRYPDRIRGIAFMEAIVAPCPDWDHFPESAREIFQGFRSPAGEEMILNKNLFVEAVLPGSIIRKLSGEEMDEYRRPFLTPGEDRRPTLTWPRQLPIAGEPAEVVAIVADYAVWLPKTAFPKLFIDAEPGALIQGALRDKIMEWDNLDHITVPGIHFIQEDSPDEIGRAVAGWMGRHGI